MKILLLIPLLFLLTACHSTVEVTDRQSMGFIVYPQNQTVITLVNSTPYMGKVFIDGDLIEGTVGSADVFSFRYNPASQKRESVSVVVQFYSGCTYERSWTKSIEIYSGKRSYVFDLE